jgi:hypothetical protein
MFPPVRRKYGIGKYWRQRIPAPPALSHVKRAYSRYGITTDLFKKELQRIKTPSAILVTSLMTYWYPGVREAIRLVKEVHPGVPVMPGFARNMQDNFPGQIMYLLRHFCLIWDQLTGYSRI